MSWGMSTEKTTAAEFASAVDALELGDGYSADFARDEAEAQLAAAKSAAKAILASGALGTEGEYLASLSGHAEPGHERREGYSGDFVNVIVQRFIDYAKDIRANTIRS